MPQKIFWIVSHKQDEVNSASELGRETLGNAQYSLLKLERNPFKSFALIWNTRKKGAQIYYQFGTPIENLLVALLVLSGTTVIAHYLDRISEGYPNWARFLRLDQSIKYILRRAAFIYAISPAMRTEIKTDLNRSGPIGVKFRTRADSELVLDECPPKYKNCVIFAGNLTEKTNLSAIVEAHEKLKLKGLELIVFTRTRNTNYLRALKDAGVDVRPPLSTDTIVEESFKYSGQLLPFNKDEKSRNFYEVSTPSKLPNLLAARRPIIYFGPKSFWLRAWLGEQKGVVYDLEKIPSSWPIKDQIVPADLARRALRKLADISDTTFVADAASEGGRQ